MGIMEEIAVLELKQKRLIQMLSQIDPVIYLQKLQQELSALQETNRRLKLTNIAERLERNQRGGSRTSSPRLPDSTSGELRSRDSTSASNSSSSSSSSSGDEDDVDSDLNIGGCSSGCCLASPRRRCDDDVANLEDVEEEDPPVSVEKVHEENSVEDGGLQNPAKTDDDLDGIGKSGDLEVKFCVLNRLDEEEDEEDKRENGLIATKTVPLIVQKDEVGKASSVATAEEIPLKKSFEAEEEEKAALGQKEEKSNEV